MYALMIEWLDISGWCDGMELLSLACILNQTYIPACTYDLVITLETP